jgi:hypothetical protein
VYASLFNGKILAVPLALVAPLVEGGDAAPALAPQLHVSPTQRCKSCES